MWCGVVWYGMDSIIKICQLTALKLEEIIRIFALFYSNIPFSEITIVSLFQPFLLFAFPILLLSLTCRSNLSIYKFICCEETYKPLLLYIKPDFSIVTFLFVGSRH
ncbi:Hypothetical predicted protein [Olea europaea subsp. europaea]|uniref:Uncharacterized protein n=1 Tax=Olea europaea subsp. europaea TaxID=158383 RepID=A0A8S0R1Z2_OLEEU|nr:Hypothetical predicted protein [Olea europaea subsp. europaea]